jgi:hypothetical protein
MRIKSRWRKGKEPKTIEERALALGFICWQISAEAVLTLENNQYQTDNNDQRLDVIEEYSCFFIQCADRLVFDQFDEEDRHKFITSLALKVANTLVANKRDFGHQGDIETPFLEKMNARLSAYAECEFPDNEPGYSAYRILGNHVQTVMGDRHNRWVPDQIIDIDAPQAYKVFKKSMNNLMSGTLL